jgi:hypothetical protein
MRAKEFITEMSIARRKKKFGTTRLQFKGYRCTKDCSGHKAGYFWAKRKGLNRMDQIPQTPSNSFKEGCMACVKGR